jgi:hypothetical protein
VRHCGNGFPCSGAPLVIALPRKGEEATMTFTIHASKDGHLMQTLRLRPQAAVLKARSLKNAGWEVHITNQHGDSYRPQTFDELLQNKEDPSGLH